MHGLTSKIAGIKGKTDLSSSLYTDQSEAKNSSDTVIYYPLPWSVAAICDLSSGAKGLFAKLCFDAW